MAGAWHDVIKLISAGAIFPSDYILRAIMRVVGSN
jgi:hypothetical protein